MGGGGDSGDGGAAERQRQQEASKAEARAAINAIFGIGGTSTPAPAASGNSILDAMSSVAGRQEAAPEPSMLDTNAAARQASYDKVKDDVLAFDKNKLDTDKEPAARQLKFALLRSGNSGGGLDIDQNNLLQRKYDEGLLDATNNADAAALGAKSSDETARLNILNQINAGTDQGSAIAAANTQLKNSADTAISTAKGQSLGNAFDNAGLLYQTSQANAGSSDAAALYSRLFGKGSTVNSAATGFGGTVNRT